MHIGYIFLMRRIRFTHENCYRTIHTIDNAWHHARKRARAMPNNIANSS